MAIRNAEEASEVVRQFLAKMGWTTFLLPRTAERVDNLWIVEFTVGFKGMRFEVDAEAGEILRYKTLD